MKYKFIFSYFLILCSAFASSNIGAGLVFGQRGTGVHFSNDWKVNQKFYLGLELRFLDIKNENEQTAVDYFTFYCREKCHFIIVVSVMSSSYV